MVLNANLESSKNHWQRSFPNYFTALLLFLSGIDRWCNWVKYFKLNSIALILHDYSYDEIELVKMSQKEKN